jgi:coproporphyrinogen III oxidase-like Fe-S oxidoreductase
VRPGPLRNESHHRVIPFLSLIASDSLSAEIIVPDLPIIERSQVERPATAELPELRRRMRMPQRHRLLHGYPQPAVMARRHGLNKYPFRDLKFGPSRKRGLLVGVLPHPFCNPAVTGCGFCTFPHEVFSARKSEEVVDAVIREIKGRVRKQGNLRRRVVTALYFGGATANLTPAEPFRALCRTLAKTFDLTDAEVTLEGVPAYFLNRQPLLVDILRDEIPARHFRLSMGIQTFDLKMLERMGRLGFGTPEAFQAVVELAHARGFTISADLLFNLPGQSLDQMKSDVARAIGIGVDHVGLYHLVMFKGLGTPWSKDNDLLAELPSNERACDNWLVLRSALLEQGFYQTTLTNFERFQHQDRSSRFLYEECSFRPDQFEMLGFGPSAISFTTHPGPGQTVSGYKTLNPDGSEYYLRAMAHATAVWNRWFTHAPHDLQIMYLTRRLSALKIDRKAYGAYFGSDPLDDFPGEFAALVEEALVDISDTAIVPTPRGMFYADSIAVLWARKHVRSLREEYLSLREEYLWLNSSNHMG